MANPISSAKARTQNLLTRRRIYEILSKPPKKKAIIPNIDRLVCNILNAGTIPTAVSAV